MPNANIQPPQQSKEKPTLVVFQKKRKETKNKKQNTNPIVTQKIKIRHSRT